MKKIGKKLSYLVKVFMAVGLLFSNISSISVVFADELDSGEQQIVDNVNEDDDDEEGEETGEEEEKKDDEEGSGEEDEGEEEENAEGQDQGEEPTTGEEPTGEETPAVEFIVNIDDGYVTIRHTGANELDGSLTLVENFAYTDGSEAGEEITEIDLTDEVKEALVSNEGFEYESDMFFGNEFNGTYSVKVTLGGEERAESFDVNNTAEGMEWDLLYMLDDGSSAEEEGYMPTYDVATKSDDGKYIIPTEVTEVLIVGWLNPSGITPSMTFTYDGVEYTAEEMFWGNIFKTIELDGRLHGEFTQDVAIESSNGKTYAESFRIAYGEYKDNTDLLNESAKNVGLDNKYLFFGDTANGTMYFLGELDEDEIASIIEDAFNSEAVEYTLNGDILTITDDNGVVITYGSAELSDETQIDGSLNVELPDDTVEVTSGDTFTVNYVVTLKDYAINGIGGTIDFDSEILRLIKAEATQYTGSEEEGKFIYVGEPLMGEETTDEDGTIITNEKDYVLLTLTFEAQKAGTSTINVKDAQFFSGEVYYGPSGEISTEIVVNPSDDSSLSSLRVAGQDIELTDELDYTVNVSNDVTAADILAVATNSNARIAIAGPNELAVGDNEYTITVVSEDGSTEKVYHVTVKRAEPAEEEETTVAPVSYQEPTYDDTSDDSKVSPDDDKKKDDDDSDDDSDETNKPNLARIIIIALILLVIAGLIYLIFKDDDDEETKKANKDIEKLKKEDNFTEKKDKVNNNKNNKKGR